MNLPIFCIVGARPVKAIATADGGMDILAYCWEDGSFERHMEYLEQVVLGEGETEFLSENDFNAYVTQLRQDRGHTNASQPDA